LLGGFIGSFSQAGRQNTHPFDQFIKSELLVNAWCPGCGIGTTVNAFFGGARRAGIDPKDIFVVSGSGCTGRIVSSLNLHATQAVEVLPVERAVAEKKSSPEKQVVVFLNDADLIAHGVDAFIETARTLPDILIIYINTLVYPIAQCMPVFRRAGNSVYESRELPYNIPYLATASGAHYVARWTALHTRRLTFSVADALGIKKLSVIEVISPCLMYYTKYHPVSTSLERGAHLARSKLNHAETVDNLDLRENGDIIIGVFKNGT
jgi:2-oxoglutarate ferredoxin oxidoreductase subunit beta